MEELTRGGEGREPLAPEFDALLPAWEWSLADDRVIAAPPGAVWRALGEVRPRDLPLGRLLARLRLGGAPPDEPLATSLLRRGWVVLSETAEQERILGLVGRFWRRDGGTLALADRAAFVTFDEPGYAKLALRLRLSNDLAGTRLVCVAHVHATDAVAAQRFRWYWRVAGLGAQLVVASLLRAIGRRAERSLV